jgi:hypothetical protein
MAEIAPSDDRDPTEPFLTRRVRTIVSAWRSTFGIYVACRILGPGFSAVAATNQSPADEIPALRPPRDLIPATYWEQHSSAIIFLVAAAIIVVCALLWFLLRPKSPARVPPELEARQALEALRRQRETGAVLSRVSQILRSYLAAAFDLPPGEMTTAEFCEVLTTNPRVGTELSSTLTKFLRGSDEQKFSPAPPPATQSAVEYALRLVWLAQTRLQELRKGDSSQTRGVREITATSGQSR